MNIYNILMAGGIVLCLLLLLFLAIETPFWGSEPGYIEFTDEFLQMMKADADIKAIRLWLNEVPRTYPGEVFLNQEQQPACIRNLEPSHAKLTVYDSYKTVRLVWGGGFGYWGLVVGPETMETPESDLGDYGEYRVHMEPGAYVFNELH